MHHHGQVEEQLQVPEELDYAVLVRALQSLCMYELLSFQGLFVPRDEGSTRLGRYGLLANLQHQVRTYTVSKISKTYYQAR